jgi:hypothetical protein
MVHVWGRIEVYKGFWLGNLRERDHLEDPGVDGRIILRLTFSKCFYLLHMLYSNLSHV